MAGPVTLEVVTVDKPEDVNVIIGQAHFIKTVEDLARDRRHDGAGAALRAGVLRGLRAVPGPHGPATTRS